MKTTKPTSAATSTAAILGRLARGRQDGGRREVRGDPHGHRRGEIAEHAGGRGDAAQPEARLERASELPRADEVPERERGAEAASTSVGVESTSATAIPPTDRTVRVTMAWNGLLASPIA